MRKNPILQTPRFQNLTPDLVQELDALKSHLEKPSRASESYESGSSFGEHTISLYEVLARVHGPNIIPQINNIMSSIVRTLKSSAGSLPLHQACSKVAPAIARYAIDPSTNSSAKENIITSICKPLSDVLMDYNESVASGSALCLQILAECENWRFASDEMVNEVCLRVSGALEEDKILTNAHFGLVMALSKCNALVLEAYSRSLIRSGLRIIQKNDLERNSQRRFSAIQTINFLIKCVDSRSVVSELGSVMDVMEKLEEDPLMFIRGAAFEALETAKRVIAQESLRSKELPETPLSGRILGLASPESRSVDSFLPSEGFPSSLQSSALQSRRSGRRLWTDYRDSDYNSNGRINPPVSNSIMCSQNLKFMKKCLLCFFAATRIANSHEEHENVHNSEAIDQIDPESG